jgi:predicted AAA+ superfamily ATPase
MTFIARHLAPTLRRVVQGFPVVAVTGPRQSGKTTLVRQEFADKPYVSLEDPAAWAFAQEDPQGFLARYRQGAVFDEAQRWPALFSWLQGWVDEDRQPGRFILTGSQQFGLMAGVSQSLAGRVSVQTLLPLSWAELRLDESASLDTQITRGGYPALHAHRALHPADWHASYVATYLERDVRQVLKVQELGLFQRFVRLCAGRVGQLLNLSALANEAGINQTTARAWLSVLESSHLVYLLPPYHRNFGKRLVKTPKLYFTDTGLACWLLGIRDEPTLSLHPGRGALFENAVLMEFVKARVNAGQAPELYFWRDNHGLEADIVFERPAPGTAALQTVEIKSGQTVTSDAVRAGQRGARFAGEEAAMPWLVHGGSDNYERSGVRVIGWRALPQCLQTELVAASPGAQRR